MMTDVAGRMTVVTVTIKLIAAATNRAHRPPEANTNSRLAALTPFLLLRELLSLVLFNALYLYDFYFCFILVVMDASRI